MGIFGNSPFCFLKKCCIFIDGCSQKVLFLVILFGGFIVFSFVFIKKYQFFQLFQA